jgi:hypothetical protein
MTDQEIARVLEDLIREDGKRPPEEQVRDLIEAGVIDKQGRVLVGNRDKTERGQKAGGKNGRGGVPSRRKKAGT